MLNHAKPVTRPPPLEPVVVGASWGTPADPRCFVEENAEGRVFASASQGVRTSADGLDPDFGVIKLAILTSPIVDCVANHQKPVVVAVVVVVVVVVHGHGCPNDDALIR